MSDSLFDILKNRSFDEPDESLAIKSYVMEAFQKTVAVTVRDKEIIITAQGAAFTSALRMRTRQIQAAADSDKRLVFRIA